MRRIIDGWIEHLKAIAALAVFVLLARVAGIEHWVGASLSAFLSLWGLRVGVMMWRSTGRRGHLASGVLFSLGAACMAAQYASKWASAAWIPFGAAALALILASIVVSHVERRNIRSSGAAR